MWCGFVHVCTVQSKPVNWIHGEIEMRLVRACASKLNDVGGVHGHHDTRLLVFSAFISRIHTSFD